MRAIAEGDLRALTAALRDGADPDDPGAAYQTPLELAVGRGDASAVRMLLDAGADPNNTYEPILPQAVGGPPRLLEYLIIAGADLDAGSDGETALVKAAGRGDLETVELLLEADADPRKGSSPLLEAAEGGHAQIVRRLVPLEGRDVGAKAQALLARALRCANHAGRHPKVPELFEAIESDDLDAVDQWLSSGLPADALMVRRWSGPRSALRSACLQGREKIARRLLDAGAPIEGVGDDEGRLEPSTPLIDAIRAGALGLARWLIDQGADVEARRDAGAEGVITPLLHLVGPDVPMKEDGTLPIPGILQLIERFAEAGADLDTADASGRTPLIWAARRGEPRLVERLLRLGADPEHEDVEGNTARTHATSRSLALGSSRSSQGGFAAVLELLRDCRPRYLVEAELIHAALHGDLSTVRHALHRGADVNHRIEGTAPMEVAVLRGHGRIIDVLLDAGAEVDERCRRVIDALLADS